MGVNRSIRLGFTVFTPLRSSTRPPSHLGGNTSAVVHYRNTLARTQFASLVVIILPAPCRLLRRVVRFAALSDAQTAFFASAASQYRGSPDACPASRETRRYVVRLGLDAPDYYTAQRHVS